MITVETANEVTPELVADVTRLLPQLSSSAGPPTPEDLRAIVGSHSTELLIARDSDRGGAVVGMLTLVTYRIPTGLNALIEDVVVDNAATRGGIGTSLVRAGLEEAARRGARHVDLTSRPSREAANRLYLKMGFVVRETNVYRYSPS